MSRVYPSIASEGRLKSRRLLDLESRIRLGTASHRELQEMCLLLIEQVGALRKGLKRYQERQKRMNEASWFDRLFYKLLTKDFGPKPKENIPAPLLHWGSPQAAQEVHDIIADGDFHMSTAAYGYLVIHYTGTRYVLIVRKEP